MFVLCFTLWEGVCSVVYLPKVQQTALYTFPTSFVLDLIFFWLPYGVGCVLLCLIVHSTWNCTRYVAYCLLVFWDSSFFFQMSFTKRDRLLLSSLLFRRGTVIIIILFFLMMIALILFPIQILLILIDLTVRSSISNYSFVLRRE